MFLVINTHRVLHLVGESDIKSFVSHLNYFKGQKVVSVSFSQTALSNW